LLLAIVTGCVILFRSAIGELISLALRDDRYTSTIAIPLISFGLIWLERKSIFADVRYSPLAGAMLPLCFVRSHYDLSIRILALVMLLVALFTCFYGLKAARRAAFPLLFLFLMVPIPTAVLDRVVATLQKGSADVAHQLFRIAGVPVFRDATFKLSLPGVTIQVAQECSGIRSSVSLFISSLVAGYMLLKSGWSRTFLALASIPIVILKNAVRIVTISLLSVYVDPGFMYGRLHHQGGLVFAVLALGMLGPVLLLLMKMEQAGSREHVTAIA